MSHDPDEDPTVPGGERPRKQAEEDRTVPSGDPRKRADREDFEDGGTVPALDRDLAGKPSSELLGKTIGSCRIDKLLGRGAMGAVYKARQLKLDRDVAVKVIRPEMMTDPRMLRRFEVEARTVGKFNSANVVMVHDVGFELGVHYLVMEFVNGTNLREHVKLLAGGRLPVGEALPLIRQACKGLDEARRLGVVHRDIKPDNLMLTDQGVLKIADFGIAKPVEEDFSMTLTSELIGTPLYMSPEQCQGGAEIDFRSDMYSLGATFFYLLTGEPPIRASSVYELIQTKTKLENLCLWKALPELDENNPLSKVIERMTANDREDRYDSYEALLNDLVLVEAGQTIVTPERRAPKPVSAPGARPAKKKSSFGLVAMLVLLLAGAAGGGYWYVQQQKQEPGGGDPGGDDPGRRDSRQQVRRDPDAGGSNAGSSNSGNGENGTGGERAVPTVDRAEAETKLARLRTRLRDSGPSTALREDAEALVVPASMTDLRQRLLDDIAAGGEVEARLAALERPQQLELPFDDLAAWFGKVDEAARVDASAGGELRAWADARAKQVRATDPLGTRAILVLVGAFSQWQQDRVEAAGADAIAELGSELDVIEKARLQLIDLLPSMRSTLEKDLPVASLDAARKNLTEERAAPAPERDVSAELERIAEGLRTKGPVDSVRDACRDLVAVRVEQQERRKELLDAIDTARQANEQARALSFPSSPRPPFDDVKTYYEGLRRALQPLRDQNGGLSPWAEALERELCAEDDLFRRVSTACGDLWTRWQRDRRNGATLGTLERAKGDLETALQAARQLFPQRADQLAAVVPDDELDRQMVEAQKTARLDGWREDWDRANERVAVVSDLRTWNTARAALTASVGALRTSLAQLGGDPTLQAQLDTLAGTVGRWGEAAEQYDAAVKSFADGRLGDCTRQVSGGRTGLARTDFTALGDVVAAANGAFERFARSLDTARMQNDLEQLDAAAAGAGLPPAVADRIAAWRTGVEALAARAAGMFAIPAGRVTQPQPRDVPAFLISSTECSCERFRRFVEEVQAAAVGDDEQARFDAVAERLSGSGMTPRLLSDLLSRRVRGDDEAIDRVTWFEASAFATWYGCSLPTADQWRLAAFGDGGAHKYPWGDEWSNELEQRNIGDRPVAVDRGGLSWRSGNGKSLHHLGGNVAEWLDAPLEEARAFVAGGRCSDPSSQQRRAAEGEMDDPSKVDNRIGFGFRIALDPRKFPGLSWPEN